MKNIKMLIAGLLVWSATTPPAAAQSVQVGEVAGWVLYDEKGSCAISSLYERDSFVRLAFDFARDSAHFAVADPAWKSVENGKEYKIKIIFSNGEDWGDVTGRGIKTDGEAPLTGLRFHLNGSDFLTDFGNAASVLLLMGDTRLGAFKLTGTRAAVAKLRDCAIKSYKQNPPDPFASVSSESSSTAVDSARARGNPGSWITNADYPDAAIRAGESGVTGFRLDIGTDGRVTSCTVTSSSGSSLLDSTACRLLQRRARFSPAKDQNGQPTTDTYSARFRWILPDDGSVSTGSGPTTPPQI